MDGRPPLAIADNALAAARDVLRRAPLIDGHNDLPWVIRVDKAARGDVVAYDSARVHERADTDIPRLREGMVGAQFLAAFQPTGAPHPARTALEQIDLIRRIEEAHPGGLLSRAAGFGLRQGQGARKNRLVHRGRGRGRAREFAEPLADLARGGRAADDALPQRVARLGRFGDGRAAQRGPQCVRPRRDRRTQPARHRDRPRACHRTRGCGGCST